MALVKAPVLESSEPEIRTRSGYKPADCLKAFESALGESGITNTGRALHFSADLVCSGAYDVWVHAIWNFTIEHIGIGSPRVFVYLKKRIGELDALVSRLDEDTLWKDDEFQTRVTELILVLRECPQRSRLPWPKVGSETHRDGWLKSATNHATETEVIRRVYKPSNDTYPMHAAACEVLHAVNTSATEKALFWVKWLMEEDQHIRKENQGSGLTSLDRGPPHIKGKGKTDVGFFLAQLFVEAYKEFAARQLLRMNEEYQVLNELFRGADSRISAKGRRDLLGLMIQILCEVPKWKVPAAPTLIKDPMALSRTIQQSTTFFREVLAHPRIMLPPKSKSLFKTGKESTTQKAKAKQGLAVHNQFAAYEAAMNAYLDK